MTTQTLDEELAEVDRSIRALEDAHHEKDSPTYHRMLGRLYAKRAELYVRLRAAQEARRGH